jgi:4-amino-4-deoxy-L-arabinose transferase-like glycosyltransferase
MTRFQAGTPAFASNRYTLLLAAVLAGLLAYRLLALSLNQTDLFFDEAQYWAWSQELALGYFSKPPLIAWIIRLTTDVCGQGEFCARLASPILYTVAAVFIYLAAAKLYDAAVGFWSAVIFSTVPGISFSAGIISTDVPLLACWCGALFAWIKLQETRNASWAVALGLAIGLGLLAKYAMVYFLLCAGLYIATTPDARWMLRSIGSLLVILVAGALIAPNLLWNADVGWITVSHTAANANWAGDLFKPLKMLEFLGAQFGVFGPILFAILIWIVIRAVREPAGSRERMLLYFTIPVIAIITLQALISRAHANWAAVAYPAATILVTATMLRLDFKWLFRATLSLNLIVLVVLGAANFVAPRLVLPGKADPYARVLGWRDVAGVVGKELRANPYGTVLTEDRLVTAEMLYYLREHPVPILAWSPNNVPRDHFELTRPFGPRAGQPILLVTLRPTANHVTDEFESVEPLGEFKIPAGPKSSRTVSLFALSGYRGK